MCASKKFSSTWSIEILTWHRLHHTVWDILWWHYSDSLIDLSLCLCTRSDRMFQLWRRGQSAQYWIWNLWMYRQWAGLPGKYLVMSFPLTLSLWFDTFTCSNGALSVCNTGLLWEFMVYLQNFGNDADESLQFAYTSIWLINNLTSVILIFTDCSLQTDSVRVLRASPYCPTERLTVWNKSMTFVLKVRLGTRRECV